LSVTTLPAGDIGQAKPFLRVDGFFFAAASSEEQTKLALTFAKFMTSERTQTWLAQEATLLPTNNLAITLLHDPALSRFVKQSKSSTLLPDKSKQNRFESGNHLYHQVLVEGLQPAEALRQWLNNNTK
jgi:maltose-binding protein MalE